MAFRKILGIILIMAGAYLCFAGNQRSESLVGGLQSASLKVANRIDGANRVADSTWYYICGGVLIAAGAFSLLRGGRSS